MNELCIYIALYCVLLYTQSSLQSCGGSLLNQHQCAASTWIHLDSLYISELCTTFTDIKIQEEITYFWFFIINNMKCIKQQGFLKDVPELMKS